MAELKLLEGRVQLLTHREVLHGITAVAELKLEAIRLKSHGYTVLHGITAVAELKHRTGAPFGGALRVVLHGITAVAELKLAALFALVFAGIGVLHGITAVAELKLSFEVDCGRPRRFSTASPPWPN